MITRKLGMLASASVIALALGVACSNDATDGDNTEGGSGGSGGMTPSSSAGRTSNAGSAGSEHGGSSPSGGTAGKSSSGTAGHESLGGEGGATTVAIGGAGGAPLEAGGQAGADAIFDGGDGGDAGSTGSGGSGGETAASCGTARAGLLGAIASVSTGAVEITSEPSAALVTLRVDASAGGYMAAASNPYIYISLARKAAVAVSDPAADTSLAWDLALKRDNIRSNGGDSGAGSAQIAAIEGVDFDAVTVAAAATADFGSDQFIDHLTCEPVVDAVGKPLTRFDGWYEYDLATSKLAPADKVYVVRAADGTSLFKLQITGYYLDVSDGLGGTVSKSAVYSLKYLAL